MCSNNSMASANVILKYVNQTKIKAGCQSERKVVPNDSKRVLPLTNSCRIKYFKTILEVN